MQPGGCTGAAAALLRESEPPITPPSAQPRHTIRWLLGLVRWIVTKKSSPYTNDMETRRKTCSECRTPYNAVDNENCPYCDFPDLSG